ncbi:hypothetical protein [Sabulicella rubraurantiaca]|uniref:hypothetical protein n=1 Tax=Sabulicella rubraurantiaca TaxID=2811429 RepID=UPI001F4674F3|nr:hypothetical protein [Sabulicella rubraurantiaca]
MAGIFAAYLADKGKPRAEWAWARLRDTFGALRPDRVTRPACRDYAKARRAQGASDGTIQGHNPASGATVELPSKPPPKSRHLTRSEYLDLLNAATTPHVRLFIIVALATAGRMGAVLGSDLGSGGFRARGHHARQRGADPQGPRHRADDRHSPPGSTGSLRRPHD